MDLLSIVVALQCAPLRRGLGHFNASGRYCQCTALAVLGSATSIPVGEARGSTIEAINHTHLATNQFSVDGRFGVDIAGPYQGGPEYSIKAPLYMQEPQPCLK